MEYSVFPILREPCLENLGERMGYDDEPSSIVVSIGFVLRLDFARDFLALDEPDDLVTALGP